jgi:hypothetical protein
MEGDSGRRGVRGRCEDALGRVGGRRACGAGEMILLMGSVLVLVFAHHPLAGS